VSETAVSDSWRRRLGKVRYISGVDDALKYRSGEQILKGDHVLFHGNPASVELVAFDRNQPEHAWYVQEFGGGVLISDPLCSGSTFVSKESLPEYEDLEFVARSEPRQ
jgi:hypothetical protein